MRRVCAAARSYTSDPSKSGTEKRVRASFRVPSARQLLFAPSLRIHLSLRAQNDVFPAFRAPFSPNQLHFLDGQQ